MSVPAESKPAEGVLRLASVHDCGFADLMEFFADLICVVQAGRIVLINSGGAKILGAARRDLIGRPMTDFLAPAYADLAADGFAAMLAERDGVPACLRGFGGRSIEVELTVRPFPSGGSAVILTAHDVSKSLRAGQAMLRSEARFRRAIDLALDFTCICLDGTITYMNAAGRKLMAATHPKDVVGRRFEALLHDEYAALAAGGLEVLAAEAEPIPIKFRSLDGRQIDVEVAVFSLDQSEQEFMIEARDVSERKLAAQSVVEREQRLHGVMNAVADGILTASEGGCILTANPAAEALLRWGPGELVGHDVTKWMLSRPGESRRDTIRRYRDVGLAQIEANARVVDACRKDGSCFPVELTVSEVRFGKERVFIAVVRDVTQRQQYQQEILRARDQLELRVAERTRELADLSRQTLQILNATSDAIIGIDGYERVSFANPAANSILCWPIDRLPGRDWREFASEFRMPDGGDMRELLTSARSTRSAIDRELVFSRRSGEQRILDTTVAPIVENDIWQGAVIVMGDITQRKMHEHELRLHATTDSLTGAFNRRHFLELSQREIDDGFRRGNLLCVVLFDVDHFKRVNDTHGHDAGDAVLRGISGLCLREKRTGDIFGRIGGEEFAFVLPGTDSAGAATFGERLKQLIADLSIELAGGKKLSVTISLGIASTGEVTRDEGDGTLGALIKLADSRLYRAKKGGRNRLVSD